MLSLTRTKKYPSVTMILPDGRHATVIYGGHHKGHVKFLFDAPTDVKILRTELLEQEAAEAALATSPEAQE